EDKKQYARAEVKRRLTDSPQRQAPRCPHFGVCGGYSQLRPVYQSLIIYPFIFLRNPALCP
ncbi:hypothetical protein KS917_27735, partial [Klebsiella pneumoniae]|nr:hypothetical protein [Klebsiella pneumoniae]